MYQVETVYLEFLDKISNMLYGNFKLFWSGKGKDVFDILGMQNIFKSITFCLCRNYQTY